MTYGSSVNSPGRVAPGAVARDARPEILLAVSAPWIGVARLPRILHEAGCRVVLLSYPKHFAAHSRYIDELLPAPRKTSDALTFLKQILAARKFDWVILGDDPILGAAVEDPGPWRDGWFPVDASGAPPLSLVSKTVFARTIPLAGLPFPPSEVTAGAGAPAAAARIGYPVIVKPDRSSAGKGLLRAEDPTALSVLPGAAPVVVQRCIEGNVGSTAVLFSAGRPLCWMSSYKEEVHPKPFGPSSVRRYVYFRALEAHLERLGALFRMTGLCGFDWIQPAGSEGPLFLELNGRPTPWLHLHRQFDVDFPGAIRAMLRGSPVVVRPPATAPVPVVRMFPQDASRAVTEGDWGGFVRGSLASDDAPRDDPRLLRALRRYLLKRVWRRVWRYPSYVVERSWTPRGW